MKRCINEKPATPSKIKYYHSTYLRICLKVLNYSANLKLIL